MKTKFDITKIGYPSKSVSPNSKTFDFEKLGKDLSCIRYLTNANLRQAEREMKVPHATIHRLESGKQKDIQISTLIRICKWTGISPTEFFNSVRK